ncbi:uncharacterized protein PAN0_016c5377 [Moesziomyces antarcticus]|uniref:Uncharacterized protein n=1 Tax=Pseudozyma antarctica TaxID=84753 RepID=A0A081CKF5_PSEA2|nr:uncharacterized protein PAN0_016c5377 [Moesziomyces antarcticus]GAK67151.1 hypothetical protein PAN0_016c5377 [Moesziomyces antarcticus]
MACASTSLGDASRAGMMGVPDAGTEPGESENPPTASTVELSHDGLELQRAPRRQYKSWRCESHHARHSVSSSLIAPAKLTIAPGHTSSPQHAHAHLCARISASALTDIISAPMPVIEQARTSLSHPGARAHVTQ